MKFKEKMYALYLVFPYLTTYPKIKNRFFFIKSLLFNENCVIKFKNGINYEIKSSDYGLILHLLSLERLSQIFHINEKNVEISFDGDNRFYISPNKLTKDDKGLITLLNLGIKNGAFFIDKNHSAPIKNEKIVKIIQDKQNIVETYEGIKFFLDTLGAVSFVETFVSRIHDQYSTDLKNKVVIDVGAFNGDTPLYFASKGAIVYAFEMSKINYEMMIRNLELNPNLASSITPVHAAIGRDGTIEYHEDAIERVSRVGGASFIINRFGENSVTLKVAGMTLKTIFNKFNIDAVHLLKLDCKGCEFFLNKKDLEKVKLVKIEYYALIKSHKIRTILNLLKELNYQTIIFKHPPEDANPIEKHGNILAEKILNS